MPRKKKTETATSKRTTMRTTMTTLNEIMDELEPYRAKYGNCPVVSVGGCSGDYAGKASPWFVCVRINADESRKIYVSSLSGTTRTIKVGE